MLIIVLLISVGSKIYCGNPSVHPISEVLRLDNTTGLSSQKVYSFVEDKNGAIWISTKAGIDRYNGRILKNYSLEDNSFYGDMGGRIIRLYIDEDTLFAYDSSGKIYKYSEIYDSFEPILNLADSLNADVMLNKVLPCREQILYATNNGLFVNIPGKGIKSVIPDIYANDIICVDNRLFVATYSGLEIIDDDGNVKYVDALKGLGIQSLFYDEEAGVLYVGTFNRGLYAIKLQHLDIYEISKDCYLLQKPIRSIVKLNSSCLAIGVDGSGVLVYDASDRKLVPFVNTEISPEFSFTGNGIYALYKDSHDNLWIGSYTGGVTMVVLSTSPTRLITRNSGNKHSLANNNVNFVIECDDSNIWYATDRGISIFNPSAGSWHNILDGVVVVSLCQDCNGNILAGCYGDGVYRLDNRGRILDHWMQDDTALSSNYIFAIKVDSRGLIWIGSPHGELVALKHDGTLKHRFEIYGVMSIQIVDDNNIGVATGNGFYVVDVNSNSYSWYANFQEQSAQNISAYIVPMLFNTDGSVWIGTEGGGLNLYNMKTREILREIKTSDGLPSNDVYGLVRDSLDRVWVSTGNGLCIVGDSVVSSLNYINGIAREYNKSSVARTKDGDFIFGSTAGAVRISSPEMINIAEYPAPLRITGISIDGVNNDTRMKDDIYDMLQNHRLILSHDCNSFDIEFESINIEYRNDICYKYMLENYDSDWSDMSTDGHARFRNLPSGDYVLRISALRKSDGSQISQENIDIKVLQPWWNTVWARIIYIIIIFFVVYFIIRYKWYQLRKEHDEDKIRFFVNTAHDIRTPLSLVMSPLEELKEESSLSDKARYLLDLAGTNIRKLNSITAQLLEFEKIDSRKAKARLEPINLNYFLAEEVSCFKNVCEKKGIDLQLLMEEEQIVISADRHLLELMLDNLLSNACKYTNPGGRIDVSLKGNKSKAIVVVSDTGIGIPDKEQKNIFTNVYRAENARASQETGNGFGLLQVSRIADMLHGKISFSSKLQRGTTFTISFKRIYDEPVIQWNPGKLNKSIDQIRIPTPTISSVSDSKGETLLIVEDNDDLRNYLTATFSVAYNVVSTISADDALTFLENYYPDIIISDVMMPGMQGDEFCRIVKNNPDTSGIPIILLTAKTTHDAIVNGLEQGADDYIAKPFSLDILKTKVRGLLSNRKRLREFYLREAVKRLESTDKTSVETTGIEPDISIHDSKESRDVPLCGGADKDFIDNTVNLIIENMADTDFDIDRLCREMAMSRTLFFGRLKSLTGKGPQEFMRMMRLERAAELLRAGVPVGEVALQTGFANSKYFSTLFKKHFGISPSKYSESAD